MSNFPVSKGTILIVDQDLNSLLAIANQCQSMGYMTLTAQGGEEGDRYLRECGDRIDMLLLDPDMHGLNEIQPITTVQQEELNIPAVIISALHYSVEARETLGVQGYIRKPFSLGDLNEVVQRLLEDKSIEAEKIELDENVQLAAKVMLVDDESDACEVINEILYEYVPDATFTVKWAKSGEEAIQLSKEFEPDIAIVDMRMPGMSGDELIRKLKAGEGYCPREFVIYTGVVEPELLASAKNSGHHVMKKPADLDTLFEVLKRICLRQRLIQRRSEA